MEDNESSFSGFLWKYAYNKWTKSTVTTISISKEPNLLSLNPSIELQNISTKCKIHTNLNKEKENFAETNKISSENTEKKIKKGVFWTKIIILNLVLISFMNIHWIDNQSLSYSKKTKVEEEMKILNKTIIDVVTFFINNNITIQG